MGSQVDRIRITGTAVLDTFVIAVSYGIAPTFRDVIDPIFHDVAGAWAYERAAYNLFLVPVVVCTMLSLWGLGCYEKGRRRGLTSAAPRILAALIVAQFLLVLLTFYVKADFMSRGVMLLFLALTFTGLLIEGIRVTSTDSRYILNL